MSDNEVTGNNEGAWAWAVLICVGLVVALCWYRCDQNQEEELESAMRQANIVAYEVDQLLAQDEALIATMEYEQAQQNQQDLAAMQNALYGSGEDFFSPQVSFGSSSNTDTRNDPAWVARNKNEYYALDKKVALEKKAILDAESKKDKNGVTEHTNALAKAKSSLELQISILNRYNIKP